MEKYWEFLDSYVKEMGYLFIIDALEREFGLSKPEAIEIYDAWKKARPNPEAEAQLRSIGREIGKEIQKIIDHELR